MPVIAHIMLALVYVTASVVGAVALYTSFPDRIDAITATLIGAATSLALIQLHMALSRLGGGSDTEKQLFEMRQEHRKLTARVAQVEQYLPALHGHRRSGRFQPLQCIAQRALAFATAGDAVGA